MRFTRPAMVLGVVSATLALTLSACSAGSSAAKSTTGSTKSINVWTWTGAPGDAAMTKLATAFEAKTGIKVNSKVVDRATYTSQVQLALNSKEAIDVLGVQPSQFALQMEPQLQPVSAWQSGITGGLGAYSPNTIEQAKKVYAGNAIYSVPFGSTGSAVCFYNKDILDSVGVSAPKTWADMKALSVALAAKKPGVLSMVMPAAAEAWFEDEFVLTMVGQTDPSFFDNVRYKKGSWDAAAYTTALARYGKLYTDGTLDRSVLDLGYTDAMNAFNKGKAAIVCNGTWEAGMLKSAYRTANGLAASSIGVMPVPADGSAKQSLRSFLDVTWGIPKASKNTAAAAEFISFATVGDGVNLWADDLGFLPAKKGWTLDSSKVFAGDKAAADGYTLIQKLVAAPSSDRNNMSALSAQAGTYILEVAQGRMTAKDAATKIQADSDSGKYN